MPPPKPRLHNKTGKLKTIKKPTDSPSSAPSTSSDSNSRAGRDSDADRQFELELCWCIQQLESSLSSGKLNPKQTQDTEKALKTLKSGNQPVIKKRQLMRTTFGDYRAKMAEEEKKMSLATRQIKFANASPNKKSYFVKKSVLLSSGKDFKFNFPVEQIEQLNISEDVSHTEKIELECKEEEAVHNGADSSFHYIPSGNSFRFNFDIENS